LHPWVLGPLPNSKYVLPIVYIVGEGGKAKAPGGAPKKKEKKDEDLEKMLKAKELSTKEPPAKKQKVVPTLST
jgi:hypothetical protein